MGLSEQPEWMGPDRELERDVRKMLDRISDNVPESCDKAFEVEQAGNRLLVTMRRGAQTDKLLTVHRIDDNEYFVQEFGKSDRELAIYSGPREKAIDSIREEIMNMWLENWERQAVLDADDPDIRAAREAEIDELESAYGADMSAEDHEAVERLLRSLDDGKPKPPGLN